MRISDWSSDVCSSDLGDMNPLHIDPDAARRAGFDRPILHGLCTYGIACRAVIEGFAGWDPERLASLAARFSAPVFPGDALVIDLWRDGDIISDRKSTRLNSSH